MTRLSISDKKIIGDNMQRIRNRLKLTQSQVGDIMGIESASYISRMENGKKGVNLYSLLVLSSTYNITMDSLLRGCSMESDNSKRYSRLVDLVEDMDEREYEMFLDYGMYLKQLKHKATAFSVVTDDGSSQSAPEGVRRYTDNRSAMLEERYVSETSTYKKSASGSESPDREDYNDDTR